MARAVAIATMVSRVRQRADIQSATARYPDTVLVDLLGEGLAELYEKIGQMRGHASFYRKSVSFQTIGNQSQYDLLSIGANDLYHLTSIDVAVGGSNWVCSARPFMESERNQYRTAPIGWTFGQPVYYALWGNSIEFIPQPSGGYQVTLNYVPAPLVYDSQRQSDAFDGVAGWEEYAVLWAVKRVAMQDKDDDLFGMADGELAKMAVRVTTFAAERDDQPDRVNMVRGGCWSLDD